MIVRNGQATIDREDNKQFGVLETARYSDAGGLTQFGAYVQTLQPGARSSERHWHEREDEFCMCCLGK